MSLKAIAIPAALEPDQHRHPLATPASAYPERTVRRRGDKTGDLIVTYQASE